ncbi:MAG: hypothetical protein KKH83_03460, partial [Candidatus Margulisbacteria bacterium]|nr:hypothetical protein [Candidatus Margulisiibacteriota bacterium]
EFIGRYGLKDYQTRTVECAKALQRGEVSGVEYHIISSHGPISMEIVGFLAEQIPGVRIFRYKAMMSGEGSEINISWALKKTEEVKVAPAIIPFADPSTNKQVTTTSAEQTAIDKMSSSRIDTIMDSLFELHEDDSLFADVVEGCYAELDKMRNTTGDVATGDFNRLIKKAQTLMDLINNFNQIKIDDPERVEALESSLTKLNGWGANTNTLVLKKGLKLVINAAKKSRTHAVAWDQKKWHKFMGQDVFRGCSADSAVAVRKNFRAIHFIAFTEKLASALESIPGDESRALRAVLLDKKRWGLNGQSITSINELNNMVNQVIALTNRS